MHKPVFPPINLPIQTVTTSWLRDSGVKLSVLRADLADPLLSGNKYFKLKYNLQVASEQGKRCLLSFGGAWSNHLHALAAAGQRYGFATVGVVRGEAPAVLNACLQDAADMGMHLHFLARSDYRQKQDSGFLAHLRQRHGDFYLLPEGGANLAGIRGCQELVTADIAIHHSHIVLACGTGTTMTGLITATTVPVIGIQVLKGDAYLQREISGLLDTHGLQATAPWQVRDEFHGGGYARCNQQLLDFMAAFSLDTGIPLEPVYSGKLFLALAELIKTGFFARDARILAIHGGGLQGRRGWNL